MRRVDPHRIGGDIVWMPCRLPALYVVTPIVNVEDRGESPHIVIENSTRCGLEHCATRLRYRVVFGNHGRRRVYPGKNVVN